MKRTLLGGILFVLVCAPAYGMQPSASQAHNSQLAAQARADEKSATGAAPVEELPADNATNDDGDVHTLDVVEVEKQRHELGKATIGGTVLKNMPSRSGSITEALRGMSNVQFSNSATSGQTAGEITPPRISIAGAKPYENNYMIDGMSVSNGLNPGGLGTDGNGSSHNRLDVMGGDQTIFYDTSLIDNISVYSSNVPAKYGSFVGGVVDAELREPRTDRWHGMVSYNHTRSKWFNLRGEEEGSQSPDNQPKFQVDKYAASADGPVTDNVAVLAAVSRHYSEIPLVREKDDGTYSDDDQFRSNDNYLLKTLITPSDDLTLTFDATYAPYREKRWRELWEDSDWELYNNALRLASSAEYMTGLGKFTTKLGYSQNGYSRDTSDNHVVSDTNIKRGGTGDAEWETKQYDLGLDWESDEFEAGPITYSFDSGLQYTTKTTEAWNDESAVDVVVHITSLNWTIVTTSNYYETSQEKSLDTFGYYAQSDIVWDRLTLTPGVRVDYDDFSENTDIAPRFKAEYDTFGDGTLRLVGGANRYYGNQLQAYAFDRFRPAHIYQTRDTNGDGVPDVVRRWDNADNDYSADGIDTPYSDEYTGGVLGAVLGFEYGLEYVHRNHEKQLVSKSDDEENYYLTNDGSSEYDGVTLTLARAVDTERFGNHVFTLGATKSTTKTDNGSYDDDVDVNETSNGFAHGYEQVFYNGELIDRADLPADDYNAPLVLTLGWEGKFIEDRFRVNSVTRWRDSTNAITTDKRYDKDTPYGTTSGSNKSTSSEWLGTDGKYHTAYEKRHLSGGTTTDVSLEFDTVKQEYFTMTLELDIYNIFDTTVDSSVNQDTDELAPGSGRAFYAGVRCEF